MRALADLPKAHLHLHLEAAMRPSTLLELADAAGMPAPAVDRTATFAEFIAVYQAACVVLRGPEEMTRLFVEMAEDAAAQGAVWVEPQVDTGIYTDRLGRHEAVLDLFLSSARAARAATGVGIGLIMCADRTRDPAVAEEQAKVAAARAGEGVVAFGLANDEEGHPPELFAEAFAIARDAGLLSTPHAGELAGPESVRGALDVLHADRLGHGVRAVEDPALLARLAAESVCCDVCPTSNLHLGLYPSIEAHPVRALLDAGVPVTLNADDPLMFGASLLDEYELVRRAFALDDEAMAAIARTSVTRSGMPAEARPRALDAIDAWLA